MSKNPRIQPLVCCVVLNWNNADETIACVESLTESEYKHIRIIIVDNASTDDSVEILTRQFPDIVLLQNSYNAGYAGGNNLGIQWAMTHQAEYVLVINNDVVVEKYLLSHLLDSMIGNPAVGVATGKIYYKDDPDRLYSGAGAIIPWRCSGVNRGTILGGQRQHMTPHVVGYVCGALFLARADVFRDLGLLDERFFMYFEDLEFSKRVIQKYTIFYNPKAIGYHKSGGGTRWINYPDLYLYYHTRNRFIVFENEPAYYRWYVLFFTVAITILKSIAIVPMAFDDAAAVKKRLSALWNGLVDGMRYFLIPKQVAKQPHN